MFERLRDEQACEAAETTVRRYVRRCRRELGLSSEGMVPQAYAPGAEAQSTGVRPRWRSGGIVRRYTCSDARLLVGRGVLGGVPVRDADRVSEGHVRAFEWFDGVSAETRYDHLSAAVKRVLRGRRRAETDRFVALRSHYLFESAFTTSGLQGAHEKGGIEGEVGRFRRHHLVPVPTVRSLGELTQELEAACEQDLERRVDGRPQRCQRCSGASVAGSAGCLPSRTSAPSRPRCGSTRRVW